MGVIHTKSTMPGAGTPIFNICGVSICWDIADELLASRSHPPAG
jgi:hypothetical protein